MLIGIDFDNTIVSYDELFHKIALEQGLIPPTLPVNKSEVRNHLRAAGIEEKWTEMQGLVYGARIREAVPYPGVLEFFHNAREAGISLRIISHKTLHPFLGEKYNLHEAATAWLEANGFFDPAQIGLSRDHVFLELTRDAKIDRLLRCGCTHFIDDLPEFLSEANFPPTVEAFLFDPNDLYATAKWKRFRSWIEASETLLPPKDAKSSSLRRISAFVERHGFAPEDQPTPLAGGGNNRVYRVRSGGRELAVKEYFQNASDPRDRFGAEKSFYEHAVRAVPAWIPAPLGWDVEQRLGLFAYLTGRKLEPIDVVEEYVAQAARFILELNADRASARDRLANASEACFSIAAHLVMIERRVDRLRSISTESQIDEQASQFIAHELIPLWNRVSASIKRGAGAQYETELSQDARWISPSDFGFHNAILGAEKQLHFFDFEYAGWDDPAKLVCDFFCQPQIPVPRAHWETFVKALTSLAGPDSSLAGRFARLLPAHQIKWCCIMLNEFLRGDRRRRQFAQGAEDIEERKERQLQKARAAFALVREEPA